MLPAGAVAGWGSHPLESAALSRRTRRAAIANVRGCQSGGLRPSPALVCLKGFIHERDHHAGKPWGFGPPVAQSSNSAVWTTGSAVPAAICVMQPMFPAAMNRKRQALLVPPDVGVRYVIIDRPFGALPKTTDTGRSAPRVRRSASCPSREAEGRRPARRKRDRGTRSRRVRRNLGCRDCGRRST